MEHLSSRRLAVAVGTAAAAALAVAPVAAAPPSSDVTWTAPYAASYTSTGEDGVAANTGTQEVTADRDQGSLSVELTASCAAGLCSSSDGTSAYSSGYAAVGGTHRLRTNKAARVTVTALVKDVSATASAPASASATVGVQMRAGWAGTWKSCGTAVSSALSTYTITCTSEAPEGGTLYARAYLSATVQDSVGDGTATALGAAATAASIDIKVEPLPAA